MRYVVAFGRFWYDFIVGDDWRIAVGVATVLVAGAAIILAGMGGEWLAPLVGMGLVLVFALPVLRAGRGRAS
ncbi:MAG: hypothetical protein KF809_09375 [Chloroflexi bacterium]|nr:hypothetical protein [Chloroflexota bacterium]